jgi:DNA-binding response OmpR family regulator
MRDRVTVVAVLGDGQDRQMLRDIFEHSNWELRFAPTLEAANRLMAKTEAGVLVVGEELPDQCTWRDALGISQSMAAHPLLIVASRLADERLWAEVLNIGAYDVLATPFDPSDVYRVISFAWQTWRRSRILAERGDLGLHAAAATV